MLWPILDDNSRAERLLHENSEIFNLRLMLSHIPPAARANILPTVCGKARRGASVCKCIIWLHDVRKVKITAEFLAAEDGILLVAFLLPETACCRVCLCYGEA